MTKYSNENLMCFILASVSRLYFKHHLSQDVIIVCVTSELLTISYLSKIYAGQQISSFIMIFFNRLVQSGFSCTKNNFGYTL